MDTRDKNGLVVLIVCAVWATVAGSFAGPAWFAGAEGADISSWRDLPQAEQMAYVQAKVSYWRGVRAELQLRAQVRTREELSEVDTRLDAAEAANPDVNEWYTARLVAQEPAEAAVISEEPVR